VTLISEEAGVDQAWRNFTSSHAPSVTFTVR